MKKWKCWHHMAVVLIVMIYPQLLYGVDNLRKTDVRSLGMAGNGVTQSCYYNPALLSFSANKQIYLDYSNAYGLKTLGHLQAGFHLPISSFTYGLHLSTFGYDEYRISQFRLAAGKQLSHRFYLGIGVQYQLLQTILLEKVPMQLSTDVGCLFQWMDNLLIGLLIMNVPAIQLGKNEFDNKSLTQFMMQTGFQWYVMNSLLIAATIQVETTQLWSGQMGCEYLPFDAFAFRLGCRVAPFEPTFGVGYRLRQFQVDAAASWHRLLGISSGLGLRYNF